MRSQVDCTVGVLGPRSEESPPKQPSSSKDSGYISGRRVEVELPLDGRLLAVDRGWTLLVVAVSPDPDHLRGFTFIASGGPTPAARGSERPGYPPRSDHPWRKRTLAQKDHRLTESLSS